MSALWGESDILEPRFVPDAGQADFPHLSASIVSVNFFEKRILRLDHVGFATKLTRKGNQEDFDE